MPGYQVREIEQGFAMEEERCPMNDRDPAPHRGRLLHFRRGARLREAGA